MCLADEGGADAILLLDILSIEDRILDGCRLRMAMIAAAGVGAYFKPERTRKESDMMVPARVDLSYREKGTSDWTNLEDEIGKLVFDPKALGLKENTVYEVCVRYRQPQPLKDHANPWACFELSL